MGTDYSLGCKDCREYIALHKWLVLQEAAEYLSMSYRVPLSWTGKPKYLKASPYKIAIEKHVRFVKIAGGELQQALDGFKLVQCPHTYIHELVPLLYRFTQAHAKHHIILTCDIGEEPWTPGEPGFAKWKEIRGPNAYKFYLPRNLIEDLGVTEWRQAEEYLRMEYGEWFGELAPADMLAIKTVFERKIEGIQARVTRTQRKRDKRPVKHVRSLGSEKPDAFAMLLLSILGWLMIAAGALCAAAAVMEVSVYGQFAAGGRFHYEGYGPGSFMFALITLSLLVYAVLAAILLALGYGHVRHLAWSVLAAEALVWAWMAVGLPLLAGAVVLTLMSKAFSSVGGLTLMGAAVLFAYPVAPLLLLHFYRRARSYAALRGHDPVAPPLSARGPAAFLAFVVVILLLPMLMGSLFPWFGGIVNGVAGTMLLLVSAAGSLASAWGVFQGWKWGWRSAGVFLAMLILSTGITTASMTVGEMIAALDLAPAEAKWFAGLPFLNARPVALMVVPCAMIIFVLLTARRSVDWARYSTETSIVR